MLASIDDEKDLNVVTTAGTVLGFIDTYPLGVFSNAKREQSGGRKPVKKWLGVYVLPHR